MLHVAVLLFEPLNVASRGCPTSDAICGPTFCIILQTRGTSSWQSIASDFAYLRVTRLALAQSTCASSGAQTHFTAVACLASSCRRLQLLLDGIRKLFRVLSFDLLGRSAIGLSGTTSFLRHLAGDSPKWTGRSRGVEGRSRSVFKPSNLSFVELQGRCDNANVLYWRCRIQRKRVVLLFVPFSRKLGRGVAK